jgi:hypothetical protein
MIKLSNNRILIEKEHYSVIKPEVIEDFIPVWCEICNFMLSSIDDETAYQKFHCCDDCSQQFARPNIKHWNEGWRPNEKELQEAISRRSTYL